LAHVVAAVAPGEGGKKGLMRKLLAHTESITRAKKASKAIDGRARCC
jgi:hypothetical protein